MSQILTRDHATDKYDILSTYPNIATQTLEAAVCQALVSDKLDVTNSTHMSPAIDATSISWAVKTIDDSVVDATAMFNYPAGTIVDKAALVVQSTAPNSYVTAYASTLDSSCGNSTQTVTSLNSSTPFYDTTIKMVQSRDASFYCQSDASFSAVFDMANPHIGLQQAVNSRFNSVAAGSITGQYSGGEDPVAIIPDGTFNTNDAFGMSGYYTNVGGNQVYTAYYAELNTVANDGTCTYTAIDPSFQLQTYGITVADRDMQNVTLNPTDDIGIFRFQKGDATVTTKINGMTIFSSTSPTDTVNVLPFYTVANPTPTHLAAVVLSDDGQGNVVYDMPQLVTGTTISAQAETSLFGFITSNELQNLLGNTTSGDSIYTAIVKDQWNFNINVNENQLDNGGYYFGEGGYGDLFANSVKLDDTNLLDSPYYMQAYATVGATHSMAYTSGTVTLTAAGSNDPSPFQLPSSKTYLQPSSFSDKFLLDSSNGEVLDTNGSGVNGFLAINGMTSGSRTVVVDVSLGTNATVTPQVYYAGESNASGATYTATTLNNVEMAQPLFEVELVKVMQQSSLFTGTLPSYMYASTSNAYLSLYSPSTGPMNSMYNAGDIGLVFSLDTTAGAVDASNTTIWRIDAANTIVTTPQSFYADAAYTTLEQGIAVTGTVQNLLDSMSYSKYQAVCVSRTLESLSLRANAIAAGWTAGYTGGVNDTHLISSADSAFASSNNMPAYNNDLFNRLLDESLASLSYTYTYGTLSTATRPGALSDFVDVVYQYPDADSVTQTEQFRIDQNKITRTYVSMGTDASGQPIYRTTTDIPGQTVDSSTYTFSPTSGFSKPNWIVKKVEVESRFVATFLAQYSCYTNVQLTTCPMTQKDTYYVIYNTVTGRTAPHTALSTAFSLPPPVSNFTVVEESVVPASGADSVAMSGTFTKDEMLPFEYYIQGGTTVLTATPYPKMDVYYGSMNSSQLMGSSADVSLVAEYAPFASATNMDAVDVILDSPNYYIPFDLNFDQSSYTVTQWSSSATDFATNTSLSATSFGTNRSFMTPMDGYSAITSLWDTLDPSRYTVARDASDNVIIRVLKADLSAAMITLTVKAGKVFLGQMIVTYSPNDVHRMSRLVGPNGISTSAVAADINSTGFSQVFVRGNINGSSKTAISMSSVAPGVAMHVTGVGQLELGAYGRYRVRGDLVRLSMFGTTEQFMPTGRTIPNSVYTFPTLGDANGGINELGEPSMNGGSNVFTYTDGEMFSASLTFNFYRGAYVYGSNVSAWKIVRTASTLDFIVNDAVGSTNLSQRISTNVSYGGNYIVNNLQSPADPTTGAVDVIVNLGLAVPTKYSILPGSFSGVANIPLVVRGDYVTVSIVIPNVSAGDYIDSLNLALSVADATDIILDTYTNPVSGDKTYTMTINNLTLMDLYSAGNGANPNNVKYPTFTFGGNIDNQLGPVTPVRPSRVKLLTATYLNAVNNYIDGGNGGMLEAADSSLAYSLTFNNSSLKVYKASARVAGSSTNNLNNIWFGNPVTYGNNDPTADVGLYGKWTNPKDVDNAKGTALTSSAGFCIGRRWFKIPTINNKFVAYFVSLPPRYMYTQVSVDGCPTVPYDYALSSNKQIRYSYFTGQTIGLATSATRRNPYATSVPYYRLNSTSTYFPADASGFQAIDSESTNNEAFEIDLTNDQSVVNNITYNSGMSTLPGQTLTSLVTDNLRRGIYVPGTRLTIYRGVGQQDGIAGTFGSPIFSDFIANMSSAANPTGTSSNAVRFISRDGSGITFSMTQNPTDAGFASGDAGFTRISQSSTPADWYNLDFNVTNYSFWNNSTGGTNTMTFYFNTAGTFVNLYTVVDLNNYTTQRNGRRVYRYTSTVPVNLDLDRDVNGTVITDGYQTLSIPFDTRDYIDFDVATPVTGASGIWDYERDVLNPTVLGTNSTASVNWTNDADFTTPAYIGWGFGNSVAGNTFPVDMFSLNTNQTKWSFIQMEPFTRCENQFGYPLQITNWDGAIITPMVYTRVLQLAPVLEEPLLAEGDNTTMGQYSTGSIIDYEVTPVVP